MRQLVFLSCASCLQACSKKVEYDKRCDELSYSIGLDRKLCDAKSDNSEDLAQCVSQAALLLLWLFLLISLLVGCRACCPHRELENTGVTSDGYQIFVDHEHMTCYATWC